VAVEDWALIASVVFSGPWSGVLAMLTTILHPMMASMKGPEFTRFLRAFLPIARVAPINLVAVLGMLIAPVVALIGLADDPGGAPFILTAIGLVLTFGGVFLVSRLRSEPNYDAMLAWDPDTLPDDWEAVRAYYFALNWIRAVATWIAFGLFLAALVESV
jgi:hypothetical protein